MKKLLTIVSTWLLTCVLITAGAAQIAGDSSKVESRYAMLRTKAKRFFENKEWASASAMFQLMSDIHPDVIDTYSRGIVSEGMRGDSLAQLTFFDNAVRHHIPFDSLMTSVRDISLSCGQTDLYEHFLQSVGSTHKWFSRVVDRYLLDYYTFRCNGGRVIAYSKIMLAGLPDDPRYLTSLAHGYLLLGDFTKAIDTYRHIIDVDPDNVEALLYLGNYYADAGADERYQAIDYLKRAFDLRPTPYVKVRLDKLLPAKIRKR